MSPERLTPQELITRDLENLSVSKGFVRSVSQKLKSNNPKDQSPEDYTDNEPETSRVSFRCLTLYSRGGGCRVSADMSEDSGNHHHNHPTGGRRHSSAGEGGSTTSDKQGTSIDCFSHAVRGKLFRRSPKQLLLPPGGPTVNACLPDDLLEMCLAMLPLASLMAARLVCRKWQALTSTPRFLQARMEGPHRTPWLFVFGVVRDGYCSGEVHVMDVSLNRWHTIDSHALKGRFLFSVATVRDEVFIVGGCSSSTNLGRVDRGLFKTHKGVLVFNPLTKSWRKAAAMGHARSTPILGVSEVGPDCSVLKSQQGWPERQFCRARAGTSDVYEDPHRLSVRCRSRRSLDGSESSFLPGFKLGRNKNEGPSRRDGKRFVMIAVGGLGLWDEPLDSCEIYDPVANKWADIQRLPLDFGAVCAGAACRGVFYVYSESDALAGYDVERGYWVRIQMGPSPARVHEYYPKLVGCGDRALMVSVSWCEGEGQIGRRNKAVRKLWELDLGGPGWREVAAHPDAPMDWNAAFVAEEGGARIYGIEMFKIFGQVLDFVTVFDMGPGKGWAHISRNGVARGLDASSCMTKSMAVVCL